MEISQDQVIQIFKELSEIKTMGKSTLEEARKTNGRVTKLEDAHNATRLEMAELKGKWNEQITNLIDEAREIKPDIREHRSFMDKLKGNWQGIVIVIVVIAEILQYFKDGIQV